MSTERAYIVYMKGYENNVGINDEQGGDITHIVQSDMLTISVWANSPKEAKNIAEELKFRVDELEVDKRYDNQWCYDVVAIIPSLLDLQELSQ